MGSSRPHTWIWGLDFSTLSIFVFVGAFAREIISISVEVRFLFRASNPLPTGWWQITVFLLSWFRWLSQYSSFQICLYILVSPRKTTSFRDGLRQDNCTVVMVGPPLLQLSTSSLRSNNLSNFPHLLSGKNGGPHLFPSIRLMLPSTYLSYNFK